MSDLPWEKRALIFIRCEYPAAFEKLVETGETAQGMFLSTSEEAGKVVGWPGCFFGLALLAQCLPDLRFFVAYPPWPKEAQMFRTCEWSAACHRVTGSAKLL